MKKDIIKQVQELTTTLVENSISIAQNFLAEQGNTIAWSGFEDVAFMLKHSSYHDIYEECYKKGAYNFLLLDYAIVQMMYKFRGNKIVAHRLAFLPCPDIERYQDSPEDYEDVYYGNQLFSDIIEKRIIAFPLRLDFDSDSEKFQEKDHPYTHATFGNYRNCRIPVRHPVSPKRFLHFILRNFYFDKFKECFTDGQFACPLSFEETVSSVEKSLVHLHFE